MNGQRFLFGDDFRAKSRGDGPEAAARLQSLEETRREAFAQGLEEGRRRAASDREAAITSCLARIADHAQSGLPDMERARTLLEEEALGFFGALARRLAGSALAERPLAAVADAALVAFRHLRGVPHVVVRVNEVLVEGTDELLGRMARERGIEGRIIVMGEPDLPPGDARFEWADGGLVRDRHAVEAAIEGALAAAGAANGIRQAEDR